MNFRDWLDENPHILHMEKVNMLKAAWSSAKNDMKNVWILQYTDMSFSLSGEEELMDSIMLFDSEEKVDDYIKRNKIKLGTRLVYDNNYEMWSKYRLEVL